MFWFLVLIGFIFMIIQDQSNQVDKLDLTKYTKEDWNEAGKVWNETNEAVSEEIHRFLSKKKKK